MTLRIAACAALAACTCTGYAAAPSPALGVDVFVSDDADHTTVRRTGATIDWTYSDSRHYRGLVLERSHVAPLGDRGRDFDRVFYRFAGTGERWEWTGRAGTDGRRLLGSASVVRGGGRRVELFAERDVLETRRGIASGQVVTFAGAAVDLPLDANGRRQLTLLGGLQDFDDGNLRTHLRATWVQVLSERAGLSAQLRLRAFRNSEPRAGDYFSPETFVEAVPTLQLRRRFAGGWSGVVTAGWGQQRQTGAGWRTARLAQASIESPARSRLGHLRAGFAYSDTPGVGGPGYGYRQFTLQWVEPL